MTVFEYVASIYSIVLALSAANTLSALAETIKHRHVIQPYWVHTTWCVFFLFFHLALWRGIWNETSAWESLTIFEMLPYFQWVVCWYIASRLLAPEFDRNEKLDLRVYFYSIKTPFLAFLMIPQVINLTWLIVVAGGLQAAGTIVWLSIFGQLGSAVIGVVSNRHAVHVFVLATFFICTVVQEAVQGAIT